MIKDFYIKEGSTLPVLVIKIVKTVHNQQMVDDMFSNVKNDGVSFSMKRIGSCGNYKIYKNTANVTKVVKECVDCMDGKFEYILSYKFSERDTNELGTFEAEFTLVLDGDKDQNKGIYKLPLTHDIKVHVI